MPRAQSMRGPVPGSAAEAASLRNGDEIVKPVSQDAARGAQEMVEAGQWEHVDSGGC